MTQGPKDPFGLNEIKKIAEKSGLDGGIVLDLVATEIPDSQDTNSETQEPIFKGGIVKEEQKKPYTLKKIGRVAIYPNTEPMTEEKQDERAEAKEDKETNVQTEQEESAKILDFQAAKAKVEERRRSEELARKISLDLQSQQEISKRLNQNIFAGAESHVGEDTIVNKFINSGLSESYLDRQARKEVEEEEARLAEHEARRDLELSRKERIERENSERLEKLNKIRWNEEKRKSALAEHSRKEGEKLAEKRKVEESQKRMIEEEKELASLVKQIEKYKKEQEFDNQGYLNTLDDLEASSRAHKIIETVVKDKSIEESFDSVAGYFEYKDDKYFELRKNVVAYLYKDTPLPEEERKKLASVGFTEKLDAFKKEIAKLVKKFDDYDISSWEKMEIFIKREYIANLFLIENEEVPLLNDGFSIEEFLEPYLPEEILLKISLAYGAWTEGQTMRVKQIKYEKEVKKFLAEIIPKLAKKNLDNPMDEEDLDDELNVALANYPVLSELQLSSKSTFEEKIIGIEKTSMIFSLKLNDNEYWDKRHLFEYIRRKVKEGFYKVKNIDEYLNETKFFTELKEAWTNRAKARFKTIFVNKIIPELKKFDFISEDDKKYDTKDIHDMDRLINSLYNFKPKKVD